jgi:hypothetical protein
LQQEVAKRKSGGSVLFQFQKQYRDDPVAFVHDCFLWKEREGPTAYQDEILAALPHKKRVAVRGPHGLGKTSLAAWITLWFALTRDGADWKAPTTASVWRQLDKFLWPEIHKWARRLQWEKIGSQSLLENGQLLMLSLKGKTGEAFAVASDTPAMIEGAHADSIFYLFDEAKTIAGDTFDAAEGAFSGAGSDTGLEAFELAISTPGEPQGRFYDIHARKPGFEDWWVRHVTLDEAIVAKRISREWSEQRKLQWGEQSAVYQNRVLGEFAASEEDGIIPLAWVEQANERWLAQKDSPRAPLLVTGVDVARSGEDRTVFALLHDSWMADLRYFHHADTMETAGRVAGILQQHGGKAIVDVIGIGAGVVDKLKEQRLAVVTFNAAERSTRQDRSGELGYINVRAEAWWKLREALDPAFQPTLALPPDDLLIGDLTAPHWKVQSGGNIQVESKDDIKKRLGRSTDSGDAVVMAWWGAEQARHKLVLPFRIRR